MGKPLLCLIGQFCKKTLKGGEDCLGVRPMTALLRWFPGKRLRVLGFTQVRDVALGKSLSMFRNLCLCAYDICHFGPSESQDCVSFVIRCDPVSLGRLLSDFPLPSLLGIY